MSEPFGVLFGLIFFALAVWFLIWFVIFVPRNMARKRNRDPMAWILVSVLGSPFVAIFILWFAGDNPQKAEQ